jgi:hypothetical protein
MVGDAGYDEITAFRSELTDRKIPYMVAVRAIDTAYPEAAAIGLADYASKGPCPRQHRYLDAPKLLKNSSLMLAARFIALRVRAANRDIPCADDGL